MNEIKIFTSEQFGAIRAVVINGEPWLVAADVCRVLDLDDVGKACERVDDDELTRIKIVSGGQNREMICVNEPGLYSLVLGSRKSEARAFKRWVTHEVLPSIRKHGAYMTPEAIAKALMTPDGAITLLTVLRDEQEKNRELTERNDVLKTENAVLSKEALQWDYRTFINKAIRMLGFRRKGSNYCGWAWNTFKERMLYQMGAGLEKRVTDYHASTGKKTKPALLPLIRDYELPGAAKIAIALCNEYGVDISELLKNIDHLEGHKQ